MPNFTNRADVRRARGRISFPAAFALMLLVALPAAWPAGADARAAQQAAAAQSPVARVPFEMNGNSLFLQARINGSRPCWFMLDTGAAVTVLNLTTVRSLGLRAGAGGVLQGAGGNVQSIQITNVTLDVGGALLKDLNVAALPLTQFENAGGRVIDGILGVEFFKRYVVEIDYETQQLAIHEPSGYAYAGRGESLPLSFEHNHPHVRAQLRLPGRAPLEGDFVIDAGSSLPLILLPSFIERHKLRDTMPSTFTTYARGVGGEFALPVGRAESVRIGGFTLSQPLTAFPAAGTFGGEGKAGNIGTAVLRRFKVVFDYSRKRVHLEPAKNFSEPFEFDMSGLGLASEGPSFSVFKVARVLPGTPASEAGLRQGDEILSVGGRPVNGTRLADLREQLRRPDQTVSLRVRRGAVEMDVQLRTRRLV
ncbi:MAG TPA: aspartyl protease family protein [Pyrinomonadaceae bacterium]